MRGVVGHLEELGVAGERGVHAMGAHVHRSELPHSEESTVLADAFLCKQRRTAVAQADDECTENHDR